MKRGAVLAVAFPLVVMAAWVGKLTWARNSGTEVQLAVSGYDPRDLLAGHYLTYTVEYGPVNACPSNSDRKEGRNAEAHCVCLSLAASGNHEASWAGACADKDNASCPVFIKGSCNYERFVADIERVYFPEQFSNVLAVVPEHSVIKVRLNQEGQGQVTALLVDGVPLVEYAEDKQNP